MKPTLVTSTKKQMGLEFKEASLTYISLKDMTLA